jgi:hypothetical protein
MKDPIFKIKYAASCERASEPHQLHECWLAPHFVFGQIGVQPGEVKRGVDAVTLDGMFNLSKLLSESLANLVLSELDCGSGRSSGHLRGAPLAWFAGWPSGTRVKIQVHFCCR